MDLIRVSGKAWTGLMWLRVGTSASYCRDGNQLDMLAKTNTRNCMKVCYKHSIPPTCFGHSCGHPHGGALQRKDTS